MVGDATFLLVRAWHGVEARLTCCLKGSGTDGGISDVGPWRDGSTDHRAIAIDDDAHTHVALDSTLYAWGDESTAVADDLTSRECIANGGWRTIKMFSYFMQIGIRVLPNILGQFLPIQFDGI